MIRYMHTYTKMSDILYLFFTIWAVGFQLSASEETDDASQKPNFQIYQFERHLQKKHFLQLAPNVILVNKTGALELRLDCWAPYPIDLRFYGHLTNQETVVQTFRKQYGSTDNPQNWFFINATMDTFEQVTGNYTCISVEDPKKFASYYIFVSPMPRGVLLTRGQTIDLQPRSTDKNIILPCPISHPDVHVHLYKDDYQVSSVAYDPKLGFTLPLNLHDQHGSSSLFGSYTCRTDLSTEDRVTINILPPQHFQVDPPIKTIRLPSEGQLNISCKTTNDFYIVTLPNTLPIQKNEILRVPNYQTSYFKYTGRLISDPLMEPLSGYVYCKWKATNESFAEWQFSVTRGADKKNPGELDLSRIIEACPKSSDRIAYECNNPIECRINTCLRKDSTCQSNTKTCSRDKHCMQNGLIQCPSSSSSIRTPVVEMFFTAFPAMPQTSNKTVRYVRWEHASEAELLFLEEIYLPSVPLKNKNNQIFQFSCQGSTFVFSVGFKWIVHFGNGSKLIVTSSSSQDFTGTEVNITSQHVWKDRKSQLESLLTISSSALAAIPNITVIECQAPVWDSWSWITRNISLNLQREFRNEDVVVTESKAHTFSTKLETFVVTLFLLLHQLPR